MYKTIILFFLFLIAKVPSSYACDNEGQVDFEINKQGRIEQAIALKMFATEILKDKNISTPENERILTNNAYWKNLKITALNRQLKIIKPLWRYELSGPFAKGTIGGVQYRLGKYLLKGHNKEKNYQMKAYKLWELKSDTMAYYWHQHGFSEEQIKAKFHPQTFYCHVIDDIILSYDGLRTADIEIVINRFALLLKGERINYFPLSSTLSDIEKYKENSYWKSPVNIDKKYIKAALSEYCVPGSMTEKAIECKYSQHNQSVSASLVKFNNNDESLILWVLKIPGKMHIVLVIKNTLFPSINNEWMALEEEGIFFTEDTLLKDIESILNNID